MTPPPLMLVTDPSFGDDVIERVVRAAGRALPPGSLVVQLRDKGRSPTSLRLFAARLRIATRAVGAWLVVNGAAAIARDVDADGVHLGRGAGTVREARAAFGRRAWVSVATHDDDDVRRARADGADAVLVSPVFATRSQSPESVEKTPRGLGAVRSARAIVGRSTAVYALGGITAATASSCARAGADGVALIRAILASAEPGRAARGIHDAFARR